MLASELISRWSTAKGKRLRLDVLDNLDDLKAVEELLSNSLGGATLRSGLLDLRGMVFKNNNLSSVDMNHCSFDYCSFDSCYFREVDFQSSCFNYSRFRKTRIINCIMTTVGIVESFLELCEVRDSDLSYSEFSNSVFSECMVFGVNFSSGNLFATEFVGCELSNIDFTSVYLNGSSSLSVGRFQPRYIAKIFDSPVCYRSDIRELIDHPMYRDRVISMSREWSSDDFVISDVGKSWKGRVK